MAEDQSGRHVLLTPRQMRVVIQAIDGGKESLNAEQAEILAATLDSAKAIMDGVAPPPHSGG